MEISSIILCGIIGGIILASILTLMEVQKHKPVRKARNADQYIKEGDAIMSVVEDKLLSSNEVKTKLNTSSPSSQAGGSSPANSTKPSSTPSNINKSTSSPPSSSRPDNKKTKK